MPYILDFKPVKKPIELENGVIYQWNCLYNLMDDPWKRHTHGVHYLYMYQDGLAPGAIALVFLLQILAHPSGYEFENGPYKIDPKRSIGTAIQQILSRHYRCLSDQSEIVEQIVSQFNKRLSRKRTHDESLQIVIDNKKSKVSQYPRPSGPKSVTPPSSDRPLRFTFTGMEPVPKTYAKVSKPVYVPIIPYNKGVTIVQSQQRGRVHFRYNRPYALQEASKINPTLPPNCCICNEDHAFQECPTIKKWDKWNARARANGKHMTDNVPNQYKTCIYPYCKKWTTHLRDVCPAMHHRCQLCKVMGHFEDQCEKLPTLNILFGIYRTHAPYGVLTRFGVPEPKALWEARLAKDPNSQPRLHVLEWGFFPPPPEMQGNKVRPKLIIFDEELRFICRRKNIPVLFAHPAIAQITNEQQRITVIKAEPYYELFTSDQTRDHVRSVCEQIYTPVTDEELKHQSVEALFKKIDELKNKIEEQEIRIKDLESEKAQMSVTIQQHENEQEQLLELEMNPEDMLELLE